MKMNKKGQGGLSMDTIIIAVIAIIVLLLIVTFFTGGMATVFGKIRNVFSGGTAGYDIDLAKNNCQDYCTRAQGLATDDDKKTSTYCTYAFKIDDDKNGKIDDKESYRYCKGSVIDAPCPGVSNLCLNSDGVAPLK